MPAIAGKKGDGSGTRIFVGMPGTLVVSMDFHKERNFTVVLYDLLGEPSDCIVNAANGGLSHGAGVAAAISDEAGPALDLDCRRIIKERGNIPVGEAVVSSAGRLPYKGVIHAVGPHMGQGDVGALLTQALASAFLRAHEKNWKSLSFPAISSGIFAVPPEVCAQAYLRAVQQFFDGYRESSLKTIRLVLVDGPIVAEVCKAVERARIGPSYI